MEIDIKFPTAYIEGEYKGSGKVVAFPINGKGVYNISMSKYMVKGIYHFIIICGIY